MPSTLGGHDRHRTAIQARPPSPQRTLSLRPSTDQVDDELTRIIEAKVPAKAPGQTTGQIRAKIRYVAIDGTGMTPEQTVKAIVREFPEIYGARLPSS